MSLKFTGEFCVMTMKNDAKFEEELTCQFKIDMRNLTNFDQSTRKSGEFCVIKKAVSFLIILLKKRLWCRCFPVNFAKLLRTLFFLQNTSGGCFWLYNPGSTFSFRIITESQIFLFSVIFIQELTAL